MVKSMKDINAVLMVVGTAIGAGMLGMPVESGLSGALPSVCCLLFAWVATLMSALLFADVLCHSDVGNNYVTISEYLLGKHTKMITLAIYLLLFISLVFAYVKGIGIFLVGMLNLSHVWRRTLENQRVCFNQNNTSSLAQYESVGLSFSENSHENCNIDL